jgi:adenylylsulfate kinase
MTTGVVVWITGLPSSGKSKLAWRLATELLQRKLQTCILDGDAVRSALVPRHGYSAAGRAAFYESLARLAALLASQGLTVLVPATAHRRQYRDLARELAPAFVEVWIDVPLDECRRRDSKGLYEASAAGRETSVPGAGEAYEPPLTPDVVVSGARDPTATTRVLEKLALLDRSATTPRAP